ncbi:fibronectin type III domain-containing protein [Aquimarina rubra]|uniref:Fibronectin type III domain-containing protein n=1 Tax=Aquimarina rubra TaxID=1920033 RepID=A0ABW5LFG0_9FLAO
MKFYLNMILCLLLLFIVGCSSDDSLDNLPPRDFDAKAISAGINSLSIRWTESTDPENSIVKYDIYIAKNEQNAEFVQIASALSEQQVSSPYQSDPDFRFFYKIENLEHNTQWKGKVVAVDQEGQRKESFFWTSTQEDKVVPIINNITVGSRKFYARFSVDFENSGGYKKEYIVYLNDNLIDSNGFLDNLSEGTTYNLRVQIDDGNAISDPFETSFTTLSGDVLVDDLYFVSQSQIDRFGTNRFKEIQGDVTLLIENVGQGGIQINDLSPLADIEIISGNLKIEGSHRNQEVALFPYIKQVEGDLTLFEAHLFNAFERLETVGGELDLHGCYQMDSDPIIFEKLIEIQGGLFIYQTAPRGFNKLQMTGSIHIIETGIINLDFLSELNTVSGNVFFAFNPRLTDYCGLRPLFSEGNFTGSLTIDSYDSDYFNPSIQDIIGGNCSI